MSKHEDTLQHMRITGAMLFGGLIGAGVSTALLGMDFGLVGGFIGGLSSTTAATVYEMLA
uniref:Uncharacterized protein n=1 Tax=viral metagenome TaxID=1070528 RepID=A0A6C0BQ94_9ZZZZ